KQENGGPARPRSSRSVAAEAQSPRTRRILPKRREKARRESETARGLGQLLGNFFMFQVLLLHTPSPTGASLIIYFLKKGRHNGEFGKKCGGIGNRGY